MSDYIAQECAWSERQRLGYGVQLQTYAWYETDCVRDRVFALWTVVMRDVPAYRRPPDRTIADLTPHQLIALVVGIDRIFAAPPGSDEREAAAMATMVMLGLLQPERRR